MVSFPFPGRLFVEKGLEIFVAQSYSKAGTHSRTQPTHSPTHPITHLQRLLPALSCFISSALVTPSPSSVFVRHRQNLGLYSERIGAINVVLSDKETAVKARTRCAATRPAAPSQAASACPHRLSHSCTGCAACSDAAPGEEGLPDPLVCPRCAAAVRATQVLSQMKRLARAMYSNPPSHGARIVAEIVGNGARRNPPRTHSPCLISAA